MANHHGQPGARDRTDGQNPSVRPGKVDLSLAERYGIRHALDRTQLAFDAGLLEYASTQLDQIRPQASDDPQWRLLSARIAIQQSRLTHRLGALDQHVPQRKMSADGDPAEYVAALCDGRQEGLALPVLLGLCADRPNDLALQQLMVGVCLKLDETDHAIMHLKEVMRLDRGHAAARRVFAELISVNNPRQAARLILRSRADRAPELRYRAAVLLAEAGCNAEAAALCAELLEDHPSDPCLRRATGPRPHPLLKQTGPRRAAA